MPGPDFLRNIFEKKPSRYTIPLINVPKEGLPFKMTVQGEAKSNLRIVTLGCPIDGCNITKQGYSNFGTQVSFDDAVQLVVTHLRDHQLLLFPINNVISQCLKI
jgi:hypothetical protein